MNSTNNHLAIPLSKVYLTLGTTEQVQFLLREKVKLLYEPSTEEIRREVELYTPGDAKNIVIWPKVKTGTGLIKSTGRKKEQQGGAIPTDQFLRVAPQKRVFILFPGVNGECSTADVSAAKKLEGGIFQLLDLRPRRDQDISATLFPITQRHKEQQRQIFKLGEDEAYELSSSDRLLIKSLGTLEGVERWSQISSKDLVRNFLLPGFKFMPLLSKTRSWCLEPYLRPFVVQAEQQTECCLPSAYLERFALWMYWTVNFWAEGNSATTLSWYQPQGKASYLVFRPSKRARTEWSSILREGS